MPGALITVNDVPLDQLTDANGEVFLDVPPVDELEIEAMPGKLEGELEIELEAGLSQHLYLFKTNASPSPSAKGDARGEVNKRLQTIRGWLIIITRVHPLMPSSFISIILYIG